MNRYYRKSQPAQSPNTKAGTQNTLIKKILVVVNANTTQANSSLEMLARMPDCQIQLLVANKRLIKEKRAISLELQQMMDQSPVKRIKNIITTKNNRSKPDE